MKSLKQNRDVVKSCSYSISPCLCVHTLFGASVCY